MNTLVSGESDAKGLSVILPYIAVGPAAVAIRRPELWNARNLARPGSARPGGARFGWARLGRARRGMARLGKAWNMGGHIRKNNKPTQPNGNNTLKRTNEPRRRALCGVP